MLRMQRKLGRSMLGAASAILLATACGGGDKAPTGPGGGNGVEGTYALVALGRAGLPTDVQVEDCILTRFFEGGLKLNGDGTWQMRLHFYDDNYGDSGYTDEGEYEQDGSTVWLGSQYSGATFQGNIAGGEVSFMYDWCYNGVPDVQLVFDR